MPKDSSTSYYGIDRGLFEPRLIESEFEVPVPNKKYKTVSSFFPEGWRKTAYELYETNEVPNDDNFYMLADYDTACKIKDIIFPHVGEHEIFFIQISDKASDFVQALPCYGYDFAYLGGDNYSAVKNGLFVNRSESLFAKYGARLNAHGLFNDPSMFQVYVADFKKETPSEADSSFWVHRLIKK